VAGGEVRFTNLTEYLVGAVANIVPAALDGDVRRAIEDLNRRALAALGIERGMTHLELYLTRDGPLFGEIAARPPGGRIMRLLHTVYGFDPWETLLRVERGEAPAIASAARRTAGVWMLHPGSGRVVHRAGLDAARAVHGVTRVVCRVREGDHVAPRLGTGVDVGWIQAEAADRDTCAAALRAAASRIDLRVE
jgi:hypothetical protein